jgi:hypothetical protein
LDKLDVIRLFWFKFGELWSEPFILCSTPVNGSVADGKTSTFLSLFHIFFSLVVSFILWRELFTEELLLWADK